MRQLSPAFEGLLYRGWRKPAYRLLAFDPSLDTLSGVVCGIFTQTPFDLTPYATELSWSPAQLSFTLADPQHIFHPDKGAARQYLADGAVIRLREGDARVDEADWVNTFTGFIKGQIGWENNREKGVLEAKVTVFSRDNAQSLKRRKITTPVYTVGTDVGLALYDVARRYLGLSDGELRIPQNLGLQLRHQVTQFCQVAPWDAITTILEAVGQVPFFDGDGRLAAWSKNMHRDPARVLTDEQYIFDDQIPARTQDNINYIRVTFLDSQLTKVASPYQKLGSAQVTTGFFTFQEKLKCYWSDDHTQRAENTQLKIIKSVNAGLLPVGNESYRQIDDFSGEITVDISVWVPILATAMIAEYLAAAAIPDDVVVAGFGASEGVTIPVGRVVQAQASVVIMLIMMSLGSAQYEVWGTPYDYAYLEQHVDCIEEGLAYYQQNKREIKNDLLGSFDQADAIAMLELTWEKSGSYPRKILLEDDPALEPGDILQLADGRKFMIQDLSKTVKRGDTPVLSADCIKVMTA